MMIKTSIEVRGDIGWSQNPLIINTEHVVSYEWPGILRMIDGNTYKISEDSRVKFQIDLLDSNFAKEIVKNG